MKSIFVQDTPDGKKWSEKERRFIANLNSWDYGLRKYEKVPGRAPTTDVIIKDYYSDEEIGVGELRIERPHVCVLPDKTVYRENADKLRKIQRRSRSKKLPGFLYVWYVNAQTLVVWAISNAHGTRVFDWKEKLDFGQADSVSKRIVKKLYAFLPVSQAQTVSDFWYGL